MEPRLNTSTEPHAVSWFSQERKKGAGT